jgi:hypothetical protein
MFAGLFAGPIDVLLSETSYCEITITVNEPGTIVGQG